VTRRSSVTSEVLIIFFFLDIGQVDFGLSSGDDGLSKSYSRASTALFLLLDVELFVDATSSLVTSSEEISPAASA